MRGLFILVLWIWPLVALAHNAPSGWAYDAECCSGVDCAPAPVGGVRETRSGYVIIIEPGGHPMVPANAPPLVALVPHGDPRLRVSGDEQRHVCISYSRAVLCVYVPPGGV